MQLDRLFSGLATSPVSEGFPVRRIVRNADDAGAGDLYVAISGARADGHDFAYTAYTGGCRLFLAMRPLALPPDAVQILTADTECLYPVLCARFFGHTHKRLRLLAITGTKGKTSTLCFLSAILREAGARVGCIGTLGISAGGHSEATCNTTPDAYLLHRACADFVGLGCDTAVLEVSSQAIAKHRVDGLSFARAVFTNLSVDHIGAGEHPSFADYRACKGEVLARAHETVLNADDAHAAFFLAQNKNARTYGFGGASNLRGIADSAVLGETDFSAACTLCMGTERARMTLSTPGLYQCYNAMAAIACAVSLGVSFDAATAAVREVQIPGRFEHYALPCGATVVIDYAHNEAALRAVFTQLYRYPLRRLVVVLGSVGERSKLRRASMGELCAAFADVTIFTADSPCGEPVREIAEEMQAGFHRSARPKTGRSLIIEDRAEAILTALASLGAGDFLLLAGKGHETIMQEGEARVPFDERQLLSSYLMSTGHTAPSAPLDFSL